MQGFFGIFRLIVCNYAQIKNFTAEGEEIPVRVAPVKGGFKFDKIPRCAGDLSVQIKSRFPPPKAGKCCALVAKSHYKATL